MHINVRVLVEAVGFGMVLGVQESPPLGRGPLFKGRRKALSESEFTLLPDPNPSPSAAHAPQSLQNTRFYMKTLRSFPGTHNQMAHHKLV